MKKIWTVMVALVLVVCSIQSNVYAFDLERPAFQFDFLYKMNEERLNFDEELVHEIAQYYCEAGAYTIRNANIGIYGGTIIIEMSEKYPFTERLEWKTYEEMYVETFGSIFEEKKDPNTIGLMHYEAINTVSGKRIVFITCVPQHV